ncbi:MAG: LON peptidase substrate-binding domain-containing protein [Actinomycetota bacterium]|nr:LON peptidase substrate-binding domain-containing protein [Actinomycetota bacterium]
MVETLPLFPLGTVLFPGLLLPLHVFEERYRVLVRELVDLPTGTPRRFGVVAIRQGREVGEDGITALHDYGCAAELRRVEAYEDGRYDIVTTGTTRFRLHELDRRGPYLRGAVDLLPEVIGEEAEASLLVGMVQRAFGTYLATLGQVRGEEIEAPDLPADPLVLSYLVAATVVVDLDAKQALLSEPDARSRLRAEVSLLKSEVSMLRTLTAAPAPDLRAMPFSLN